jgi:hypothetical protein
MLNKINKKRVFALALTFVIMFLSVAAIVDGYETIVTNITTDSSGSFSGTNSLGITYNVTGTPGSSGTVTATVDSSNPQVTADVPTGVSLAKFVTVTFNYPSSDFMQAVLTFSYTDSDVAALKAPYDMYKYNPSTNSYTKLNGVVDSAAKTITVTLSSTDDPLFAIGGAPNDTSKPADYTLWIAIVVVVIVILVAAVLFFSKYKIQYDP